MIMFRVQAIPSEPTRFLVTGHTLRCDNPQCSKAYNRMTRHQVVLGEPQPVDYLVDGSLCPKCLARVHEWKAKAERAMRSDMTLAQKTELAVKLSQAEPAVGKMRHEERLVDIASFSGNGECSCPWFECQLAPLLRAEPSVEQAMGKHRCSHIPPARDFALSIALRVHDVERHRGAGRQREGVGA